MAGLREPRRPRQRSNRSRGSGGSLGLTLLELLIALTLLVLVLTLSVPSVLTNLDRRQFNEMRAQVLTYMTLVRAEAQLHGEVLAVYFEPRRSGEETATPFDEPIGFGGLTPGDVARLGQASRLQPDRTPARLVARPYEPFLDAGDSSAAVGLSPDQDAAGDDARRRRRPTLRFSNPFRMSRSLPADWLETTGFDESALLELGASDAEAGGAPVGGFAPADPRLEPEETEPIILAVFFPDGTALAPGERIYLVHDEGNVAQFALNRWTGQAELRELTNEFPAAPEEEEETEEEYDPFDEANIMDGEAGEPAFPATPRAAEAGDDE